MNFYDESLYLVELLKKVGLTQQERKVYISSILHNENLKLCEDLNIPYNSNFPYEGE